MGLFGTGFWIPCPAVGLSCRNGVCDTPTRMRLSARGKRATVLTPIQVCLEGMGPAPATLTISPPRGASRHLHLRPEEGKLQQLVLLPPGPPGVYSVNVEQGALRLSDTIEVQDAQAPRLRLHPDAVSPGGTVQLTLAGLAPRQEVAVEVYGPVPPSSDELDASYVTALRLTTSAFGQVETPIQTHPTDHPGHYLFAAGKLEAQLTVTAGDVQLRR